MRGGGRGGGGGSDGKGDNIRKGLQTLSPSPLLVPTLTPLAHTSHITHRTVIIIAGTW
jgi:hypothetical protein